VIDNRLQVNARMLYSVRKKCKYWSPPCFRAVQIFGGPTEKESILMLLALNLSRREWSDSARAPQGPSGSLEAFGNCMLLVRVTPYLSV
jgi:hypothetical protein